jgi:hypothetical protein
VAARMAARLQRAEWLISIAAGDRRLLRRL